MKAIIILIIAFAVSTILIVAISKRLKKIFQERTTALYEQRLGFNRLYQLESIGDAINANILLIVVILILLTMFTGITLTKFTY